MFNRLQNKWGVSTRQFWIIFLIFGLTGTTTAIFTRFITGWLGMDASTSWVWKVSLRLGMLLFGYQCILLFYAALLGQWTFFWKYEQKLLKKLGIIGGEPAVAPKKRAISSPLPQTARLFIEKGMNAPIKPPQTRLAIFASGTGTNAEKIIQHFSGHPQIKVALIVCNKPGAGVTEIAQANQIPLQMIDKEPFFRGDGYTSQLKEKNIDFIVLAGFLWKIPETLINAYPDKIINIHPALLPKFGGKGMYGSKVHEAVIAMGEKESGITIHFVNEHFDEGKPIFQAKCPVEADDTPESLAQKVHRLEHTHFPVIVEQVVTSALLK